MNSEHYHPQSVPGPHPTSQGDGPPYKFDQATPSRSRIVTRTQLRTHARNANASAIEIDFPIRGLSHDCTTPPPIVCLDFH